MKYLPVGTRSSSNTRYLSAGTNNFSSSIVPLVWKKEAITQISIYDEYKHLHHHQDWNKHD